MTTDMTTVEGLRRIYRALEMSAAIMRDPARTGGWEGAERTADAFDRQAIAAKALHASLASTPAEDGSGDPTYGELVKRVRWIVEAPGARDKMDRMANLTRHDMRRILAALTRPRAAPVDCNTCCGNGEIVTDFDRYQRPHKGDKGDEAVADCPDCDGTGKVELQA